MIYSIGIDPGLSITGLCVLRRVDSTTLYTGHHIVKTEPSNTRMRKSTETRNRLYDLFEGIQKVIQETEVSGVVFGIETYQQRFFKGADGNMTPYRGADKGSYVYGMILGMLFAEFPANRIYEFHPGDIKRGMCGMKSASKDYVESAVIRRLPEMESLKIPKTHRQHIFDAAALAILALAEAKNMGIG